MHDPGDRAAGFYWIYIEGQEAEVAQWQVEWEQWLVAGSGEPLSDETANRVIVLSDCLTVPAIPASSVAAE
jgi:hypothetical protein